MCLQSVAIPAYLTIFINAVSKRSTFLIFRALGFVKPCDKNVSTCIFYILQYPVRLAAQSALHFVMRIDLIEH